ncbi:MAG: hypothetical protein R3211_01225 [Balneolaceae bacterium]|nr:hypothetical protein [Balneolaceae bacterium]
MGKESLSVNQIKIFNKDLLLATDQGIWIESERGFQSFGLNEKDVISFIKIDEEIFMAGVRSTDFGNGDTTIFKSIDNGQNWNPFLGNYGNNGEWTWLDALVVHPENTKIIFARGGINVSKTTDGGNTWKSVFSQWDKFGSAASMLTIDPNEPNIIWAGGANAIFKPNLFLSKDNGLSWEILNEKLQILDFQFEATVFDIAIKPDVSTNVLLGLSIGIFRTRDLGKTWESIFNKASVLALENSIRSPFIIYGSGIHSSGKLFITATPDFGNSWEIIVFNEGPDNIRVNDIVVGEINGKEVLFLGTNKGIYSYTFEE